MAHYWATVVLSTLPVIPPESTLQHTNTMSTTHITQDELEQIVEDATVEELGRALGLVHEDDLGDLDASRESELEAYSTGVEGADDELTGSPAQQEHVDRFEARQERSQNADPDEYGTGIAGSSRDSSGVESTEEMLARYDSDDEDLEAYGSGVKEGTTGGGE